jgi:conjugal transfer/entry exclusion protein
VNQQQKYLEMLQILINLKNKDWSPVANINQLLNAGRGIIDDVINIDKVLSKSEESKSWEEILEEGDLDTQMSNRALEAQWLWWWLVNPTLPPEQQSWRPILLPSSPNA